MLQILHNTKNPYLTLASKLDKVCLEKITTDPDQYMLANPDTYGTSVL
jgi:GTP-binding protein EngB required for normal cell division